MQLSRDHFWVDKHPLPFHPSHLPMKHSHFPLVAPFRQILPTFAYSFDFLQRCHHAQIESNYGVVFEDSWVHQFSANWSGRKNWWKIFSSSLNTRWKKNLSSSCLQTASVLGKSQCFPSSLSMISNATFKPNHFLLPQTSRNSQRHPDRAGRKTGPTFLPSAALVGVSTAPSPATFTMAAGRSTL